MKLSVAVDLNWGIGYKGDLLQKISEDMKKFKGRTLNKVVVMGRGTFESLPNKQPLKDRINIVLSKNKSFAEEDVIVCYSLEELFMELKKYNSDDVFVIGGESIYSQLLPYCSQAYVTKINNEYEADKHFPNLDEHTGWKRVDNADIQKSDIGVSFRFTTYENLDVKYY